MKIAKFLLRSLIIGLAVAMIITADRVLSDDRAEGDL